jgi:hypothetical protein
MAGIFEVIRSNDLIKFLLILLGVYIFMTYFKKENMTNGKYGSMPSTVEEYHGEREGLENVEGTLAQPQAATEAATFAPAKQKIDELVAEKDQLKADDLLPVYDDANEFVKQNPVSKLLKEQNFLVSGYHVGINTVMQSNKIPYHDIRSVPPIPKENVGPFLQSSYEVPAGTGRRFLEIGS